MCSARSVTVTVPGQPGYVHVLASVTAPISSQWRRNTANSAAANGRSYTHRQPPPADTVH